MRIQKGAMAERFILPPFSVLNTMNVDWLKRKRKWKALGIEAELGRDVKTFNLSTINSEAYGRGIGKQLGETSIFDPVLCELVYKWFNIPGGSIIDPFAGGSVRGLVAGYLGFPYTGIDLNEKQIHANVANISKLTEQPEVMPRWIIGDSAEVIQITKGDKFDFMFSCPPYYDLEIYTQKTNDISNMSWEQFVRVYNEIIRHTVSVLKDNRFACFVVGEIRDKNTGWYRSLVPETIRAFESAGMHYYNELILVNSVGTLPLRVNKQFTKNRKVGKHHQNVLVFYKGDVSKIESLDIADIFEKGEQQSLI